MVTFFIALAILILGYFTYGKLTERFFATDGRTTPALSNVDGVDYVPMKTWRVFLIQLLNIAGTGPIFGALMGAAFGPVVFLWIVFGSILGGAVHDFLTGMISVRLNGVSIGEIVGKYLGRVMKIVMRIFSIILLILVGTVFVTSPASLLNHLTSGLLGNQLWIVLILFYYILATLLPIDKLIGKIYPVFGAVLIIMAISITVGIFAGGYQIPELTLENLHPSGTPIWPFMFITVACGAISGFHATQSPLMARCIKHEKHGRKIFYGAMITEGIIALIWAAAGVAFYKGTGGLFNALNTVGQSGAVYEISTGLLGVVGGALAIIGVIFCPISSGDTAFRSVRLTIADWFKIDQSSFWKRLWITLPILAVGGLLSQIDFNIIWRYFSWSNQTLAMISLWACAVYLAIYAKNRFYSLIAAIPGAFMSAVTCTYILMAEEGFRLSATIAYPVGIGFAVVCSGIFCFTCLIRKKGLLSKESVEAFSQVLSTTQDPEIQSFSSSVYELDQENTNIETVTQKLRAQGLLLTNEETLALYKHVATEKNEEIV